MDFGIISRGTTPTLRFQLPVGAEEVDTGFFTIAQNGITVIEKSCEEWIAEKDVIKISLSQEETLLLDDKCSAEMQIRFKTYDGDAYVQQPPIVAKVGKVLKNGSI